MLRNERGQLGEKPSPGNQRATPQVATKESPHAATQTQRSPKNKYIKWRGGGESSIERKETNQIQGPGSLPGPPKHAPEHGRFVYLFREISNSLSDSENILSLFQLLCECSNMHRSGTNSHLSIFNNSQHSTYLFYLPLSHPASFILSGIFSSKSKALWYFTCKQLSMHLQQIGLISF